MAEDERLLLYESHDEIVREYNASGMLMYPESKISQHQTRVGFGLPWGADGVTCCVLGPDEVLRPDSVVHSAVLGLSDREREWLGKHDVSEWKSAFAFEVLSTLTPTERTIRLPDGPIVDVLEKDSLPQPGELSTKVDPSEIAMLTDVKVEGMYCLHCDQPKEYIG